MGTSSCCAQSSSPDGTNNNKLQLAQITITQPTSLAYESYLHLHQTISQVINGILRGELYTNIMMDHTQDNINGNSDNKSSLNTDHHNSNTRAQINGNTQNNKTNINKSNNNTNNNKSNSKTSKQLQQFRRQHNNLLKNGRQQLYPQGIFISVPQSSSVSVLTSVNNNNNNNDSSSSNINNNIFNNYQHAYNNYNNNFNKQKQRNGYGIMLYSLNHNNQNNGDNGDKDKDTGKGTGRSSQQGKYNNSNNNNMRSSNKNNSNTKNNMKISNNSNMKISNNSNNSKYIQYDALSVNSNSNSNKTSNRNKNKYMNYCYYQGQWKNNKKDGKGIMINDDGSVYYGYWKNDLAHGWGIYYNNLYYDGNSYGKDQIQQYGTFYKGQWKEGLKQGKGVQKYQDGTLYQGDFSKGNKHGKGKLIYSNLSQYEGQFQNNVIEGQGTFRTKNKQVSTSSTLSIVNASQSPSQQIVDLFPSNKNLKKSPQISPVVSAESSGAVTYAFVYQGSWKASKMHGPGRSQWRNPSNQLTARYLGQYKNGIKEGFGQYTDSRGVVYKAFWSNGEINQKGPIVVQHADKNNTESKIKSQNNGSNGLINYKQNADKQTKKQREKYTYNINEEKQERMGRQKDYKRDQIL